MTNQRQRIIAIVAVLAVVAAVTVGAAWQFVHRPTASLEPAKPPLTAKELSSIPCTPAQLSLDAAHHRPFPPQCRIKK